ncbi:MAG: DUF421 domain-containing protein [Clostridia bacterium]|nr:DUF421 domain-containing protein [Clostridia bacterium]
MATSFIRTIILYLLVILGLRIMGKRQVGEMQPSELVVAIMISDLASIPMQEVGIPLSYGIIPIFTLIIMEILLSQFSLKNKKFRRMLTGKPSVIIHNGKLLENEMKKQRFNNDDLNEQLRIQGYTGIKDIHFAILETNGQLSIIPKPKKQQTTVDNVEKIVNNKEKQQ